MAGNAYSRLDDLLTKAISAATGPTLDTAALRKTAADAFDQNQSVNDAAQAVATEAARNSPLTENAAAQQFQTALAASTATDPKTKVQDAAEDVARLTAIPKMSVGIDLSNPHMMNDGVRGAAAIVCAVLLAATGAGILFIKDLSGWAYSAAGVIAVLLVAASLVFVMGYGKAKFNISPPSTEGT